MNNLFDLIWIPLIQLGDDFAHAMATELSWHMQNRNLIGSLFSCKSYVYFYAIRIMIHIMSSQILC